MIEENIKEKRLNKTMTMIYWKEKKFWLGKFLEHPEIMTQGLTLEELELNLKDAYREIAYPKSTANLCLRRPKPFL